MKDSKFDFIIVGSGAGGSTLAWELSKRGKRVLVLERGADITRVGTFRDILNFYDCNRYTRTPKKSNEGVIIYRTFMGGGTTFVATGNIVRSYEKEFEKMGINLSQEFEEAENELKVKLSTEKIQASGSRAIYEAALSLGYEIEAMPKAIDQNKCIKCGLCIYGCKQGAKWTAKEYLDKALKQGAVIKYDSNVEEVLINQKRAYGVRGIAVKEKFEYEADNIILAAGGLGTPVILQNSKLENDAIGKNLFIDTFVNVYGITDGLNQISEPPMEFVDLEFHQEKGFILSTFINRQKMIRFIEAGLKGMRLKEKNLIGIMVKISDTPGGIVNQDGSVSKKVTGDDKIKLEQGIKKAEEILIKAGADENSILVTNPQGAHPGGTAAIGSVIDTKLETEVNNLFICDASVFPTSPGMPPILTIVALAKKLAKEAA
ncbi:MULTISPECIES: GMC family oxidoreductase N-terminal domain-containing protein [Halanaerobium]|jgi:choline dehydrogenase-like flavoprotein|uniref:Choline dehydrogenase n=1 Tax=Halanaerobium kushneri TaxID=56779 RepID=A0A1N6WXF1_9FIRM|nr:MULTISPECIES: GMC family oxidoreductase [Halanaerobium]RCW62467.1 choline dehydrogenase-like flavoprotein [Halanaerobium sp. ST460_2HS_T2]SIQ94757.1 Choline dehydrogenase [Halanaerobium kushneri]